MKRRMAFHEIKALQHLVPQFSNPRKNDPAMQFTFYLSSCRVIVTGNTDKGRSMGRVTIHPYPGPDGDTWRDEVQRVLPSDMGEEVRTAPAITHIRFERESLANYLLDGARGRIQTDRSRGMDWEAIAQDKDAARMVAEVLLYDASEAVTGHERQEMTLARIEVGINRLAEATERLVEALNGPKGPTAPAAPDERRDVV